MNAYARSGRPEAAPDYGRATEALIAAAAVTDSA